MITHPAFTSRSMSSTLRLGEHRYRQIATQCLVLWYYDFCFRYCYTWNIYKSYSKTRKLQHNPLHADNCNNLSSFFLQLLVAVIQGICVIVVVAFFNFRDQLEPVIVTSPTVSQLNNHVPTQVDRPPTDFVCQAPRDRVKSEFGFPGDLGIVTIRQGHQERGLVWVEVQDVA